MRRFANTALLFIVLTVCFYKAESQELLCRVSINTLGVRQTNKAIFSTLEKAIQDFMNNTQWSGRNLKPHEKIGCDLFITINSYDGEKISADLKIQSFRPVYNTNYNTPAFVYNDKIFNFSYIENEPLFFNPNAFNSGLISLLSYYAYVVIGIDSDTFSKKGGSNYYRQARDVINYTRTTANVEGWDQAPSGVSRWNLVDNLLSDSYAEYRDLIYDYHIKGLDVMTKSPQQGKDAIKNGLFTLEALNERRANSLLLEVFFDTKANEIQQLFSGGPPLKTTDLLEFLENISPKYTLIWKTIK